MTAIAQGRTESGAWTRPRLAALAGIAAGPLFLTVTALVTVVELDFMHDLGWSFTGDDDVPWPSGLALGDYGPVQVAGFALAGLLLLGFVLSFRNELERPWSRRIASFLLICLAVGIACLAFPTDRATAAGNSPDTWHGRLHVAAFVVVALTSLLGTAATAVALRGNARWRGYPGLTACAAVLVVVFFFPLDFLGDAAFAAYLAVVFGWFLALGLRLRALAA
jgi:hypothetical protein